MECVHENVKCSDIKAESERETVSRWSYFSVRFLFNQSLKQQYIKVYLGFAGEEIKSVLISSIR